MPKWSSETSGVPQGLALGPALFNISVRDSRIECALTKFANDTKPCGVVNTLQGRDAIHRDLDRLERRVCANLIKFNKAKCKVPASRLHPYPRFPSPQFPPVPELLVSSGNLSECAALPFVRQLESRNQRCPCFLRTLHVGGTIRTCQKFLIQYNRRQLLMLLQDCTNEEERRCIQKSLLSCSLTEEQSQSGDEEDDNGTETD
nr:PREDICTED: ribonuclease P/MRP protein subunit POP5 [Opisthocomus hoazin]